MAFREQFIADSLSKYKTLKCHYCGKEDLVKEIEDMSSAKQRSILATIDHVVPLSKGGKQFDPSNCVIACYNCNAKKGNKHVYRKNQENKECGTVPNATAKEEI